MKHRVGGKLATDLQRMIPGREAMAASSQENASASIRIVHPQEQSPETLQTPGSLRLSAISAMHNVSSSLWAGTFVVEPSAQTAIHHHGEQDTVVYVLKGESLVRWGDHGEYVATVRAGDFLYVPAWLPHQELNPSTDRSFRWVVVRSTSEPIVVNLPDDFWEEDAHETRSMT
ncbi:MAG: cupin domain-containing protein [Acidobacteriaceae bacterium]